MTDSVASIWRNIANQTPLNPHSFDRFNAEIQAVIEVADSDLALKLATIKLEANRRLYWAQQA